MWSKSPRIVVSIWLVAPIHACPGRVPRSVLHLDPGAVWAADSSLAWGERYRDSVWVYDSDRPLLQLSLFTFLSTLLHQNVSGDPKGSQIGNGFPDSKSSQAFHDEGDRCNTRAACKLDPLSFNAGKTFRSWTRRTRAPIGRVECGSDLFISRTFAGNLCR